MIRKKRFIVTDSRTVILHHGFRKLLGLSLKRSLALSFICQNHNKGVFIYSIESVASALNMCRQTLQNSIKVFIKEDLLKKEGNNYRLTTKLIELNNKLISNTALFRYTVVKLKDFKDSKLSLTSYCMLTSIKILTKNYGYIRGGYDNMQSHLAISKRHLFKLKKQLIEKDLITNDSFVNVQPTLSWENILDTDDNLYGDTDHDLLY